jgi:RNA polymerase sigma-70 factor (ECF subfamily)
VADTDESEIVARARAGDAAAFDALVLATAHRLRLFVSVRALSVELVEEVVQETYVIAYETLAAYRGEGAFLAWLYGIARNVLRREITAQSRRERFAADELDQFVAAAALDEPEPEDPPPLARLAQCLDRIAPRARAMLERHHRDGVPIAELARQFKQNQEAIGGVLKRCRQALRQCLETAP